jgi:hypothetical protein
VPRVPPPRLGGVDRGRRLQRRGWHAAGRRGSGELGFGEENEEEVLSFIRQWPWANWANWAAGPSFQHMGRIVPGDFVPCWAGTMG